MDVQMTGILFPSFVNYTDEMYQGNKPARLERDFLGNVREYYKFCRGDAQFVNGNVLCAKFDIDKNHTIYLVGNHIRCTDFSGNSATHITNENFDDFEVLQKEHIRNIMNFIKKGQKHDCFVYRKIYERVKELLNLRGDIE